MSKYVQKLFTAANAVASAGQFVILGPLSVKEYDVVAFLVENCSTLSATLHINAVDSRAQNIAVDLIPTGMLGNTAASLAPGASQAQAYRLANPGFDMFTFTVCATAAIGASQVRISFNGRKAD